MVQITGKYEHVSNSPEYEGYIKAMGGPPEVVKAMIEGKPVVTISENGGQWTMVVSSHGKDSTTTFKLGEPFDETLPNGITLKSVAKKDGNKVTIQSTYTDSQKGSRIYEFTDAGINVQILDDKNVVQASRTYKRI